MDRDKQVSAIMATNPQLLLVGNTPRLIDECQEQPEIWNYVRHEVDDQKKKAQFILTGSANSEEEIKLHSGAGRFAFYTGCSRHSHRNPWQRSVEVKCSE